MKDRARVLLDLIAAVASGLVMAHAQSLTLPFSDALELGQGGWLDWIALVGLIPVFQRLRHATDRWALVLGIVAGTTYFALSLGWLTNPMITFAGFPWIGAAPILLLLVSFLSLFWAVTFWAAVRVRRRLGIDLAWGLPVLWTALAFLRNYLMTGFPWSNIAYSQVRSLWLAQLGSLAGVYLVTFAVVLTNAALERVVARVRGQSRLSLRLVGSWAGLMALAVVWALVRLSGDAAAPEADRVRVAVIQGNLDEKARLRGYADQRWVMQRMLSESRRAEAKGAGLIVWPEGTLPRAVRPDTPSLSREAGDFEALSSTLVIGGIGRGRIDGEVRQTNSAFITDGRLTVMKRYDKRHLVPFGEYVPLASILPYEWFVPEGLLFFSQGDSHDPVEVGRKRLGMLICYEAIFPEIAREAVDKGAQLLVNITNDCWFGASASPYQHLVMSRMRSIETGRYQVRAANTGVSAILDSRGRELARLPLGLASGDRVGIPKSALAPADHLTAEVALETSVTPYVFLGDLFAWLCSALALVGIGFTWRKRSRSEDEH